VLRSTYTTGTNSANAWLSQPIEVTACSHTSNLRAVVFVTAGRYGRPARGRDAPAGDYGVPPGEERGCLRRWARRRGTVP